MNACPLSGLFIFGKTSLKFGILGKIKECMQMNEVWLSGEIHIFHEHRQDDPTVDLPCRAPVP